MKTEDRSRLQVLGKVGLAAVVGLFLIVLNSRIALAGNLDSSAAPSSDTTRMYTLEQIYDVVAGNKTLWPSKQSGGFNEPATGPASTMHTLDEIEAKIAAGTTDATADNVFEGKYFITRTAGSGESRIEGSITTQTLSPLNDTVAAGYYTATTLSTVDSDLAGGNIKEDVVIFGKTGTYVGSGGGGLPETGQTTQYDGKPDDGFYQMGTAKSYTDNGDGTVTDNVTGLMWELKTASGTGIHAYDTTYTWANAFDVFIATLNAGAGFAGHTDWRIPNIYELFSICLLEATNGTPSIDKTVFGDGTGTGGTYYTQSGTYWSSTTDPNRASDALYVEFIGGTVYLNLKIANYYVRAVRGGQ